MSHNKVIGVIPARYASTRLPGKMLLDILGKSLIQRTFENASQSRLLDCLVIATDDERIFQHAKSFGAEVFMTSPACLSGTDRVSELIGNHFSDAEIVVNIQGDEPCLNPTVIDTLIADLKKRPDAIMTTPVVAISDPEKASSPSVVKCVFDCRGRALYFSRYPIPFSQKGTFVQHYRHLGVYCFRKEFLLQYSQLPPTPLQIAEDLEQLKIIESGFPIYVSIVQDEGIGVDTWEDVNKVKLCIENLSLSQAALSPH